MQSTVAVAAALMGVASASPVHLPHLIPRIPGVTVPLAKNAPPLPILQLPTPALESPPHPVKKIKPKKMSYWWCAAGDNMHSDFLAGFSFDDDTFGELVTLTDINSSGNSPHHSGPSADGKVLWGGGLLSLLKTQDTGYYFDMTDIYNPKFMKSDIATLSSIADDVQAKPDGGFFYTYMGSAVGTSPGRLVETDENYNIVHQWPEDVEGILSILDSQFSPHGLSVDYVHGFILTSDFVVPRSVLKPSPAGVQGANTLRLWDLKTRKIIKKLTIPGGDGIQDVKFIPGNKEAAALATAVGLGEVWIIYPMRKAADGSQGVIKKFMSLGEKAKDTVAIFSYVHPNGKWAYYSYTTGNHIAQLNIENLEHPKRLDNPNKAQPIIGPHFLKVSPDGKHLLFCDYFLQTDDIGIVNTPGDYKGWVADINQKDGTLSFNRSINMAAIFNERGGARPHSVSVYDYSVKGDYKWV